MAYVTNVYQGDHVAATDLQNIENNFEYLRNNFKSGSAPPDPGGGLEGVIWWDSTKKTFKGRSDSEWRGIFSGAASFKIWAYLDTVPDGWTRDETVTDEVLAFKGGATYTTGAQRNKGSWTISGLSNHAAHNHMWQDYDSGTHTFLFSITESFFGGRNRTFQSNGSTLMDINVGVTTDCYTDNEAALAHVHSGAWRIKASVGIMLYPKL